MNDSIYSLTSLVMLVCRAALLHWGVCVCGRQAIMWWTWWPSTVHNKRTLYYRPAVVVSWLTHTHNIRAVYTSALYAHTTHHYSGHCTPEQSDNMGHIVSAWTTIIANHAEAARQAMECAELNCPPNCCANHTVQCVCVGGKHTTIIYQRSQGMEINVLLCTPSHCNWTQGP